MINRLQKLTRIFKRTPFIRFNFCKEKYVISKEEIEAIEKILHHQVKQEDLAKSANLTPEEVFKEREQLISFNLMHCTDIDSLFKLYETEQNKASLANKPLTSNEVSLFVYFTACLRQEDYVEKMQKHYQEFLQMIDFCLYNSEMLESQQFSALLWALATFKIEIGSLHLNEAQQYIIKQKASLVLELLEPDPLCSLAFALQHSITDSSQLILQIAKLVNKNISQATATSLITLINCLPAGSLIIARPLLEHIMDLFDQELITQDQLASIIYDLMRINNFQKHQLMFDLIDKLLQSFEGTIKQQVEINNMKLIDLIIGCCTIKGREFIPAVRQFLKLVHSKAEKLNITEYVSFFLCLPKIQHNVSREINLEKTVSILIEVIQKSQIFIIQDFELNEIVQIITACAALRLDNKGFITLLTQQIDIKNLSKQDLLVLAQSFVIYIRQFEDFYLRIHAECVLRKEMLTEIEKAQLLVPFNRIRILIPDSPFFK